MIRQNATSIHLFMNLFFPIRHTLYISKADFHQISIQILSAVDVKPVLSIRFFKKSKDQKPYKTIITYSLYKEGSFQYNLAAIYDCTKFYFITKHDGRLLYSVKSYI